MHESKIELTERLRREGRWSEASRFKDEALRECRAKGNTRADATDAAWEATAAAFPPLPADDAPDAPPLADTPDGEGAGAEWDSGDETPALGTTEKPAELIRDIIWANENLGRRGLAPKHAPSNSAWNILQYARKYQKPFVENLLVKALTLNAKQQDESAVLRREDMRLEEIRGVLQGFNRQWAEELAANVPEAVMAKVRTILEGWARRSALTIPSEAKTDLAAHVARLVQDSIKAIVQAPGGD